MLARAHRGKSALQVAGGHVDGAGNTADFILGGIVDAGPQIAFRDTARNVHDVLQAAGSPGRCDSRHHQGDNESQR